MRDHLLSGETGRCARCGGAREVRWVRTGASTTARLECPACHSVIAI